MPTLQEQLDAAVARATADAGLLHTFVHGDAVTSIATEGGPVPTLAKAIADADAEISASISGVIQAVAEVETARQAAQAALAAAIAARDAALAAVGAVKVTAADTTAAPLADTLIAGRGLAATIENPGGDERLILDVEAGIDAAAQLFLAVQFI